MTGARRVLVACLLGAFCLVGAHAPRQTWAFGQPVAAGVDEQRALKSLGDLPGEIVFSSRRDGKWRLFRILPNGAGLARLSTGTANHTRPFFVMGGSKLVYQSDEEGPIQIWLAEPDLSRPRRLSPLGRQEFFHGMTRDGRLLLAARSPTPQDYLLRDLKTGGERPVDFSSLGMRHGALEAALSPDGRKAAFLFKPETADQPKGGVYVADLDQEGRTAKPRWIGEGCCPAWRSDSAALLFSHLPTIVGVPGTEIWLADMLGPREQLTRSLDWDYFPAFSPDQRWMVWAASPLYSQDRQGGQYEVFVKRLHDRNGVRLTFHTAPDIEPTWRTGRSKLKGAVPDFVYEAEEFARGAAQVAEAPGASGGKVALARREAPHAGPVVYGQYDVLAPGSYLVRFRLKFGKPMAEGLVAEMDVAVDGGKRILAKRALRSGDIAPERFGHWDLAFNSEQLLTGLECRVSFYPGVADLMVDVITVKPAGSGSWLQSLGDLWSRWWGY